MSSFEVAVRKIDNVIDHPDADRLSIVSILGYEAITAKNDNGTHRYQVGDLVVYVPEQAVVPHDLLKQYGYWSEEKGHGLLAGKNYDRVKIIKLRGVYSQGLVWPLVPDPTRRSNSLAAVNDTKSTIVEEGDDLAEFFGITKYEPPLAGFQTPGVQGGIDGRAVFQMNEFALNYDFDSLQKHPDALIGDDVVATEKLHGTLTRFSYRPDTTHPDLFDMNDVAVTSKGQGAKGIVFRNNRHNLGELYVPSQRELYWRVFWKRHPSLANIARRFGYAQPVGSPTKANLYVSVGIKQGIIPAVGDYGRLTGKSVDLIGETYGDGVQKMGYGQTTPVFRAFDIAIDGVWLGEDDKDAWFKTWGIPRVPILYSGPFDLAKLTEIRDGKTTVWGTLDGKIGATQPHIREGIVVTAVGDQTPRKNQRRPIYKMVSPAYLMKEDGTEVQ